jgi:hypothetical protein
VVSGSIFAWSWPSWPTLPSVAIAIFFVVQCGVGTRSGAVQSDGRRGCAVTSGAR